ncbi:LysE family translocator [bacterium]|nr:LysE family translocator [bacterium]
MFGVDNILVFLGAGILLNLYPGPDTLYIVGRSISQGRLSGISAVLGISSGSIVHTLAGAFGFSAILSTSAHAFLIIKYLGAAYLIFQGIQMIFQKASDSPMPEHNKGSARYFEIYRRGALTNVLNPKVALFFLAFLPQFISASSPNKALSFLFLGAIFITTGTIWCLMVAIFSSFVSRRLRSNSSITRWMLKINGILYTALGVRLAAVDLEF